LFEHEPRGLDRRQPWTLSQRLRGVKKASEGTRHKTNNDTPDKWDLAFAFAIVVILVTVRVTAIVGYNADNPKGSSHR
jgi:hypothetical protein